MASSETHELDYSCLHAAKQICETLVAAAKALAVREHRYFFAAPHCAQRREVAWGDTANRQVKCQNQEGI